MSGPEKIEQRDGDLLLDGQITRAGLKVTSREELVPLKYGKEVLRDKTLDSEGNSGERIWTNYPEGAVMVVPYSREAGQRVEETTVYLGQGMLLYGIGEENGIEAFGRRRGGRDAVEVASELIEGVGLSVGSLEQVAQINETSSRQNNKTDIVMAEISELTPEEIESKNILALSFFEAQAMIKKGAISNAATIAALWHLEEFLWETANLED